MNPQNVQLRLAAYERLILFVQRMSLPELISRASMPGLDKVTMQSVLTQNIRDEM